MSGELLLLAGLLPPNLAVPLTSPGRRGCGSSQQTHPARGGGVGQGSRTTGHGPAKAGGSRKGC